MTKRKAKTKAKAEQIPPVALRNDKCELGRRERLRRVQSRSREDYRYLLVGDALLAEAVGDGVDLRAVEAREGGGARIAPHRAKQLT